MLVVSAALALLAGCGRLPPALSAEELEQRAVAVLESLPAEPIGDDFGVTTQEVKLDRPYASAHGVGTAVGVGEMTAAVVEVLEADGVEVRHDRQVDYSLGHEVLAADRRVVIRVHLGSGSHGNAFYPPLDHGTYVAIQLANVDGGPNWTEIDH